MLPERGTIGCSLSHEKALERFLESEYEFALIFEDDVIFNPHELRECVNRAIEKKDLWDILNFETFHDGFPFKIADLYENKNMSLFIIINKFVNEQIIESFFTIFFFHANILYWWNKVLLL